MRSYSAIYVDAGYLIAAAATRVTGTSLRSGVTVDHEALITAIIDQVERASGLPTLRVNWYDSAANGVPNEKQRQIAMLPRVKVRLGRLSYSGEQKGVDLRIGLDLSTQGRRRVADVAYLVSGDDDLTEAVEEAQSHGVQVILLAVPGVDGRPHAVAQHLIREADGLSIIDEATIDSTVQAARALPRPSPSSPSVPPIPAVVTAAVPSPADVAKRRSEPLPTTVAVTPPPAAPNVAYSTSTGRAGSGDAAGLLTAETLSLIDQVCRGVVNTWSRTAEPGERERILNARPSIPRELDRAMLVDLSDRIGVYDLDEATRHELRARFWEVLDLPARPST